MAVLYDTTTMGSMYTQTVSNTVNAWQNWVATAGTSISTNTAGAYIATQPQAWVEWNDNWTPYNQQYARRLTPEELAQLEEERIRHEEATRLRILEEEARRREYNETEERAKACLFRHITSEQQEQFKKDESFILKTDKRTYRVHLHKMVEELNAEGQPIASYCIYTREGVPSHDNMLNKVLLLRCDEEAFHKSANRHNLYVPLAA